MAGTMFTEVVCPHACENRKRYTVPLSIIVHGAICAIVIGAPLIATADLPSPPRGLMPYVVAQAVPAPPPVARQQPTLERRGVAPTSPGIPIEAPNGIAVETSLLPNTEPIETGSLEGFVGGLSGRGPMADEILPSPSALPLQPVRPGGSITSPTRVQYVPPEYPPLAKQSKIEGVVIIEAVIGTDGRVQDARVIRSAPLLDEAALQAVRGWEYTATLLNGQPTPVIMTVTVRFTLK